MHQPIVGLQPERSATHQELSPFFDREKRILGLDVLRATAILLVILSHVLFFIQVFAWSHPLQKDQYDLIRSLSLTTGIYGVELFFVLSGFLIGKIIIKDVLWRSGGNNLKIFYIRRWLRTLPAYYVVLIGLVLSDHVLFGRTGWHLPHFFFVQNFFSKEFMYFGVSWSLAIEEWFYLLIPAVLMLLLARHAKQGVPFLTVVAALILIISIVRMLYVVWADPAYDFGVRKCIPLRFDSLLFGVLVAGIKCYYPKVFQAWAKWPIFLSGVVLVGLCSFWSFTSIINDALGSVFVRTWLFTLSSFGIAMFLPFLDQGIGILERISSIKWFQSIVFQISICSYSLYLTHNEVMRLVMHGTQSWEEFGIRMGVAIPAVFLVGYGLYRCIESPFIRLRDHYFKAE
jgi:peptidoglycan/LPS O-acetylase OafA/YrhL